jgi:hypothetical protein
MKLDQETLDRFTKLYNETFNESLTPEDAYDRFIRLVNVLRVLLPKHRSAHLDSSDLNDTLGPSE